MDLSTLTDTVLGLYLAAKTGAVNAAADLATKLGKGAVDKLTALVKQRFAKDGPGATQALEHLEQHTNDATAQKAVRRRLEELIEEDPSFATDLKAIIGPVTIDRSVKQTIHSGDNSLNIQVSGNHNTVGGKP